MPENLQGRRYYVPTDLGAEGELKRRLAELGRDGVLLLCGDLTDFGLPDEARILARELAPVLKLPVLAVLGNHDYHSGKVEEVRQILADAGVTVLDGDVCEVQGVGFAGVKGFVGGFGRRVLTPWGEDGIKQIVREAIDEALQCKREGKSRAILFNLSGHGHFDLAAYADYVAGRLEDYAYPKAQVEQAMKELAAIQP